MSIPDSDDTEQADLRGGRSPWFVTGPHAVRLDVGENMKCDALIVGGGITGSLIAERLTRQGLYVYPLHVTTRKSLGLMMRKLSVTESQRFAQFRGTFSRRKPSVASANWAQVA